MTEETTLPEAETLDARTVHFVVHDATGRILSNGWCDEEAFPHQTGGTVLEIPAEHSRFFLDLTYYVVDGALVDRQPLPIENTYQIAADGAGEVSFELPAGTTIIYGDDLHDAEGSFAFTTETPGDYVFTIRPPVQFLDKTVTIHAI
jgi:hypothetical protein